MVDEVHTTARVNGPLFKGILWAGLAISICFVGFRLWVRRKTLKRFFSDDYLVITATFCYLLTAALQQTQLSHIYELFALEAGKIIPNVQWMQGQTQLLHHIIGFNVLFYTGIWAIKLSFLIFFRRLEGGVTGHRYWWWAVLCITIASWIVTIATMQWDCMAYSVEKNFDRYIQCGTPEKVRFQQTTFKVNCALDVGTDILILTVPVAILWNVHVSMRRKAVLIALFSATVLIMAIAIIRVTVVSSRNKPSDLSWLYFWSNIELVVALIVSSLASFRSLYVSSRPKPTSSRSTNILKRSLPRTRGILLDDETYTPVLGTKRSDVEIQNLRTASNNTSERIHTPANLA